jgi:hypothetical protein
MKPMMIVQRISMASSVECDKQCHTVVAVP